ncbi:MAG TPA: hypothetical protein VHE81_22175, partial [Lacipirellulaceae bacterium]|nr:hypothetical protein [Lacipirellulaceae bacterium]
FIGQNSLLSKGWGRLAEKPLVPWPESILGLSYWYHELLLCIFENTNNNTNKSAAIAVRPYR